MLFDRTERRPGKVLFHTPTKLGKGVLVAPTVDGNVFAGPTAVNVNDKEDTSVDANLTEVLAMLALEATPTLNLRNTIRAFAGLRAQPSTAISSSLLQKRTRAWSTRRASARLG